MVLVAQIPRHAACALSRGGQCSLVGKHADAAQCVTVTHARGDMPGSTRLPTVHRAEGLLIHIGSFHSQGEARVKPCLVVRRVLCASDVWWCIPRHAGL
jgi:hypothetical protein